jgi:hypothetical protein
VLSAQCSVLGAQCSVLSAQCSVLVLSAQCLATQNNAWSLSLVPMAMHGAQWDPIARVGSRSF